MPDKCSDCEETTVHQFVKVQAQVSISPIVKHGKPKIYCVNTDLKPVCDKNFREAYCRALREAERMGGRCTFTVTQVLCIEIPISLDVDVDVDQGIICCGIPEFGPCTSPCKKPNFINDNEEIYPFDGD